MENMRWVKLDTEVNKNERIQRSTSRNHMPNTVNSCNEEGLNVEWMMWCHQPEHYPLDRTWYKRTKKDCQSTTWKNKINSVITITNTYLFHNYEYWISMDNKSTSSSCLSMSPARSIWNIHCESGGNSLILFAPANFLLRQK